MASPAEVDAFKAGADAGWSWSQALARSLAARVSAGMVPDVEREIRVTFGIGEDD